VDALEHERTRKPAQHTPNEILQQTALQQDQRKIYQPRKQDTHANKDNIGERVNRLRDGTEKLTTSGKGRKTRKGKRTFSSSVKPSV